MALCPGTLEVSDYASSEFWVLSAEKRPVGGLESKVESGKWKERTNAALEFELACSLRCHPSLIRLKLREKQTSIMTKRQMQQQLWRIYQRFRGLALIRPVA
jgi:hypothetical protein